MTESHTLTTADGDMGIETVRPDGDGPFPVVVFFHHGPGLDDGSREAMRNIADQGYYVVAHDRYHREKPWFLMTPEMRKDQDQLAAFWAVLTGTTEDMVDVDMAAVFDFLDNDPAAISTGMGCIGYCIGARSVVVMQARHNDRFAAGVGMHPSYCTVDGPDSPHLLVPTIEGSLYVAFGSEDKMQSPEANVAFIEAVKAMPGGRGEADVLEGANHGFAVPQSPAFHAEAAAVAYDKAFALFAANVSKNAS